MTKDDDDRARTAGPTSREEATTSGALGVVSPG